MRKRLPALSAWRHSVSTAGDHYFWTDERGAVWGIRPDAGRYVGFVKGPTGNVVHYTYSAKAPESVRVWLASKAGGAPGKAKRQYAGAIERMRAAARWGGGHVYAPVDMAAWEREQAKESRSADLKRRLAAARAAKRNPRALPVKVADFHSPTVHRSGWLSYRLVQRRQGGGLDRSMTFFAPDREAARAYVPKVTLDDGTPVRLEVQREATDHERADMAWKRKFQGKRNPLHLPRKRNPVSDSDAGYVDEHIGWAMGALHDKKRREATDNVRAARSILHRAASKAVKAKYHTLMSAGRFEDAAALYKRSHAGMKRRRANPKAAPVLSEQAIAVAQAVQNDPEVTRARKALMLFRKRDMGYAQARLIAHGMINDLATEMAAHWPKKLSGSWLAKKLEQRKYQRITMTDLFEEWAKLTAAKMDAMRGGA